MRGRHRVAVLVAATAVLAGVPVVAAYAGDGTSTTTKSLGSWNIYDNAGHVVVKITNASVVWGRNSIEKIEWVTIKATFRDARSDGQCAKPKFQTVNVDTVDPGGSFPDVKQSTTYTECNGVNVTKSKTYDITGKSSINAAGIDVTYNGADHYKYATKF